MALNFSIKYYNSVKFHFVFIECGVKYKTRPGLNYHVQKAHSNNSGKPIQIRIFFYRYKIHFIAVIKIFYFYFANEPQFAGHGKASSKHHPHNEASLNPDENTTNSVFDSVYDDMNSSSSLPHVANNSHQQAVSFGGGSASNSNYANAPNSFNNNTNSKNC